MKKTLNIIFCCLLLFVAKGASSLHRQPFYTDSLFPTSYHQSVSHLRADTQIKKDKIFLGNSITDVVEWKETIYDKEYDLPALIPYPKKINWNKERYSLKNYTAIYISNSLFQNEARNLQKFLASKNILVQIKAKLHPGEKAIELWMKDNLPNANKEESYSLTVSANAIKVESATSHGLYNAIQTFKQLSEGNVISGCEIYDSPAFSWRGFMIDVGRNYQSISQIKQQIDVMAAYKLNIFHFHLTEDIAWRLQSKKYPQLTGAKYMLRNPGKYYSMEEMKDLINYCNERYITLVPEIDMPGHSAAFKRAMGVDMQSEKGTIICKNILTEICDELNVPIIHIGGDEVKISNHDFLPQMTKLLLSKNKQVIAWNPGGVLPEGTTLQMWNGGTKPKTKYPSVDSRHLYLNHFDPIDGVVATFNHKICDTVSGDDFKLGATLCNWPDRNVTNETDLIDMNAVYPILLTFSERCWAGGGWENYATAIGAPGLEKYTAFKNFEARLLTHKEKYFNKLSFPYFKQSDIEWSLIGPFDNNGNTSKPFFIENVEHLDSIQKINTLKVYGGTIWLRHFWDPMIKSHLSKQNDSVTYYAVTKIWSEKAETKNFWIGFDNLSRSTATDSPPLNEWDERNSKVWVNNKIIAPPIWARAGQKGDSEIPLIDENYEIRPPTKILLKAGWNYVLIKSPVASFKAKDWQNPVKWMFSFIPQ